MKKSTKAERPRLTRARARMERGTVPQSRGGSKVRLDPQATLTKGLVGVITHLYGQFEGSGR